MFLKLSSRVALTLADQPLGTVAVHATFLRMQEEETKDILFIEMQMQFVIFLGIAAKLSGIIIYDSFEAYETARLKVINENKYGSGFPAVQNFDGKNLGQC